MSKVKRTPPPLSETGDTLAEFATGSGTHWLILVLMPLLVALFVGCWIYSLTKWNGNLQNDSWIGLIVGTVILLGLAAPFLVGWILALSARSWRLLLCQNGILVHKRSWKDVQSIAIEDNKGISHQVVVRVSAMKKPLINVPVTSFPNVEVFFQLIDNVKPPTQGDTSSE